MVTTASMPVGAASTRVVIVWMVFVGRAVHQDIKLLIQSVKHVSMYTSYSPYPFRLLLGQDTVHASSF